MTLTPVTRQAFDDAIAELDTLDEESPLTRIRTLTRTPTPTLTLTLTRTRTRTRTRTLTLTLSRT